MLAFDILRLVWRHPANQHMKIRSLGKAVGWQVFKRLTGQCWDINVYDGVRLRCYPDSSCSGSMIYMNGMPDYDDIQFIRTYLRPGDAFVDIGANIGIYTLLAASLVGKQGRVVSFEPGRKTFDRLEENVSLNAFEQVELHFAAVGPTNDKVRFLQSRDTTNRLALSGTDDTEPAGIVPSVTLDDALPNVSFAMGKIDIEGAEPLVFQGARRLLAVGNPVVWQIELKDCLLKRYGFSAKEFARFLRDSGYELANYGSQGNRLTFSDEPWHDQENILAIHTAAIEHVRSRIEQEPT